MNRKQISFAIPWPEMKGIWAFAHKWLVPNPGTLILMILFALTIPVIADTTIAPEAASTSTISYQGRLADAMGNPLTGYYNIEFRIYDMPSGGAPLWEEFWTGANSVAVYDGLFNVMLGSINPGLADSIEGYNELYLGITVGTDSEMLPRVQLGSVPFSFQALTVADGSITTAKIASDTITTTHLLNGAVTQAKLGDDVSLQPPPDSITTTMIIDGAVTQSKAPTLIKSFSNFNRVQFGTGSWTGSWNQNPAAGTWYRSSSVTFPTPFTSTPVVFINVTGGGPGSWAQAGSPGTTGFSAMELAVSDLGTTEHTFTWFAIGQ